MVSVDVKHHVYLFTSAESIRTVRDEEPRTATSIYTQLLGSETCTHAGPVNECEAQGAETQ